MELKDIKKQLRKEIIARRDALPEQMRTTASLQISQQVIATDEFKKAQTVFLFASFGSEVNTRSLMDEVIKNRRKLILPRVDIQEKTMRLYHVKNPDTELIPGVWDIPQPDPTQCELCSADEIDCIILPGVAYDKSGGRMGYGGGFYDRLLASLTPEQFSCAIGICFEVQLVKQVPRDAHDLPVPIICTEIQTIRTR